MIKMGIKYFLEENREAISHLLFVIEKSNVVKRERPKFVVWASQVSLRATRIVCPSF
jgi:hypothetical protein